MADNASSCCPPQFKPGDKVYALTGQHAFWSTYGTYAQYVCTHESTLAPIPAGLSYQEAAAVPLAAMTAWQALEPSMPLQGKRVLVHAGAGGVGHFAIQIAKAQGAFVATTCSGRNTDFVSKLGADRAIDYTKERWEGGLCVAPLAQAACCTRQSPFPAGSQVTVWQAWGVR